MKIGIVGQGYVGTAVKEVFSKHYNVETYDLDKDKLKNMIKMEKYSLVSGYISQINILTYQLS